MLALLALAAAGCGKVSEVREPDVFAGEGIKPAPDADRAAPTNENNIRIAVVTHGAGRRAHSGRSSGTASMRPRAR